jgi:CubicO group peptidase (beta-lactamase class C family)
MGARSIPAGALAVMRNGQVVFSRGYGWLDQARTQPVAPETPFRLASVTKPFTMAAIRKLVAAGGIAMTTPVFPYLGLAPLPAGPAGDARLADITVQQLLDHRGGWDLNACNPSLRTISTALGLDRPPTVAEVGQYTMGRPLQTPPGSTYQYCNLGYWLLALVIEKASAQSYIDYLHAQVVHPAHVQDVFVAQSRPPLRNPREPWYSDPNTGCSVYVIATCVTLPQTDGGSIEVALRLGGGNLAASAPAVLRFLDQYWIDGRPRSGTASFNFFGSLPGTYTLARQHVSGVNYVALFAQRTDASGLPYDAILGTLDSVVVRIARWP